MNAFDELAVSERTGIQQAALAAWSHALGKTRVSDEAAFIHYTLQNTTEYPLREVVAVLRPETAEQVRQTVQVANEYKVPLYPFSTGRNWGLGSKLPPANGCALVNLGEMRAIREVNEQYHYAIIEPGVTQKQLSEYLQAHHPSLMLNVTGSSPDSSVVGNAIERGTGFSNHRTEDVRGVEVVLGNGTLLRTGYWSTPETGRQQHHYKYGIGPYLDGLFTQSNFGIVTALVVNLIPKPEHLQTIVVTFANEELPGVIGALSELFKQDLLHFIVHMFNDTRMKAIDHSGHVPSWTCIIPTGGSAAYLAFITSQIEAHLAAHCTSFTCITQQQADAPDADPNIRGMFYLHAGVPSNTFMKGLYHTLGENSTPIENLDDLDVTQHGMLCCLPLYPMDGEQVRQALAIVERVCRSCHIVPAVTLNPIDENCLESVMNIYFDRRDAAAVARAHECNEQLHVHLFEAGFRFYRIDIENMRYLTQQQSAFWDTAHLLKSALDPNHIIAPYHYNKS